MDPACIPADPCATAGKEPVNQDTAIWGSKYPWILSSHGRGEALLCRMVLSDCCAEIQGHTVPLVLALACLAMCKY